MGSLESLWELDMGNRSIGMGPESTVDAGRREFLGLGKQMYCNAGVLLIDLEKWRNCKLGEESSNIL
ncbi:MAG: glycosyltransferase [Streptococcus salivarius]